MISAAQLDPILPYLRLEPVPETNLDNLHAIDASAPRGAGAMIIAKLNRFHDLATEIIRRNGNRLNQTFDILAHPTKMTCTTLEEITRKVLQLQNPSDFTPHALWAVYRTIIRTHHFQVNPYEGRKSQWIHILSKETAVEIAKIMTWVREYQEQIIAATTGIEYEPVDHHTVNPLPGFLENARALVALSRKRRAVTKQGCVGPMNLKTVKNAMTGDIFSFDEQIIIRFVDLWASSYFGAVEYHVKSIVPMILRATGMYDGFPFDQSTALVFLQEIGISQPWSNRDLKNPMLLIAKSHDIRAKRGTFFMRKLETDKFSMDLMAPFRKDWAETPVFCIDQEGTLEVDDGVSLEEIQEDPSAFWVHIHVANPSAFIAPDSNISRSAALLVASRYLVHTVHPMLSPVLCKEHLSLARDRPCITFSAKVKNDGNIVEVKIAHGTIRNVKHITPEQLCRELASDKTDASRKRTTIVVGNDKKNLSRTSRWSSLAPHLKTTPAAVTEPLRPSDLGLLRKLCKISVARRRKRTQDGALTISLQMVHRVAVSPFKEPSVRPGQYRFDAFDPIISLTTSPKVSHDELDVPNMVEDLMVIAGEVAASWCVQRNIPVAYRGMLRNPQPSEPPEVFKKEYLDPLMAATGFAPWHILMQYMNLLGSTISSAVPMKHLTMGVSAYCRATSPLRRFTDMLAHWQIEAAIRRESETGKSLIGNTDNRYLPFSLDRVEQLASHVTLVEKLIKRVSKCSEIHWKLQLLFRAFYFNEAPLPETFDVSLMDPPSSYPRVSAGLMMTVGIFCDVPENEAVRKQGGMCQGDVWTARIVEINCYSRRVVMEAVQLVSRDEAWIHQRRAIR